MLRHGCVHRFEEGENNGGSLFAAPSDEHIAAGSNWWLPGAGETFPASVSYKHPSGKIEILNASGAVDTRNHPFFVPLGTNGRACVTCHQPADEMSVSLDAKKVEITGYRAAVRLNAARHRGSGIDYLGNVEN